MGYKILTLSPGSTSTKVAVFDGTEALFRLNVTHPAEELAAFDSAADQFDYRRKTILDALAEQGIKLEDIDAFSGYCGAMGPTVGGIFAIDDTVCEHVMNAGVNHPAILGAPLLHAFARATDKPAYAVNQPDTDELADVARITGFPGVYRKSHVHCLNQKECAIRCAAELGLTYETGSFIVAHVGGGLSVACHDHGRMVDTNDVLEGSGPFAPNRSGDAPLKPVVKLAYSGATKKELDGVIGKTGGLLGLLGTDDARQITARIEAGEIKNPDEKRKVTHFTDRIDYPKSPLFHSVEEFAEKIRSGAVTGSTGRKFDAVVVNGIGGSALGPQLMQFSMSISTWPRMRSGYWAGANG